MTRHLSLTAAAVSALLLCFACGGTDNPAPTPPGPEKPEVPVTSVSLSPKTLALDVNGEKDLAANIVPSSATNKKVTWTSSNPNIATVVGTELGVKVRGMGPGNATITIVTESNSRTDTCAVTVGVPVSNVVMDKNEIKQLIVGEVEALAVTVFPDDATNKSVTWTSSNPAVLAVIGDGHEAEIRAVAPGTASAMVTADGPKYAFCTVTVTPAPILVTNVTMSPTSLTIGMGGPASVLTAGLVPANATNRNVTWTSSNPQFASVTPSGLTAQVRAVGIGTSTITVTTEDGNRTANCAITVVASIPITSVTLDKPRLVINVGGTGTLTANIAPATATNRTVTWVSDHPEIAWAETSGETVKITTVSPGTATITATTADGNRQVSCPINVISGGDTLAGHLALSHAVGIAPDGTIWTWGDNGYGQHGSGQTGGSRGTPTQVGTATNWMTVTCGQGHILALREDGVLWGWGYNNVSQVTTGTAPVAAPTIVGATDARWAMVSGGDTFSMALRSDGTLWGWGRGTVAQIGDGQAIDRPNHTQAGPDTDWVYVSAGQEHAAGLKPDGALWTWGRNNNGQIGDGTTMDTRTSLDRPPRFNVPGKWKKVSCGGVHTIAIKEDGTLWAWGSNQNGQQGNGTSGSTSTFFVLVPTQVGEDTDWAEVKTGAQFNLALKTDGTLWAWGANTNGQLGVGDTVNKTTPTKVNNDTDWAYIVPGGFQHSFAMKLDGSVWAWGNQGSGRLGNNTVATTNVTRPTMIDATFKKPYGVD